jgi:hypothetical protein
MTMKTPPLRKASDAAERQSSPESAGGVASYPGVASVEVRWQRQLLGAGAFWQQRREPWQLIDASVLGEFIDCPEPECTGGGCCIGAVIRDMVLMKAHLRRGRVRCKGQRGPAGKLRWRLCINVFKYDVRVVYLEDLMEQVESGPQASVPSSSIPPSGIERRAG